MPPDDIDDDEHGDDGASVNVGDDYCEDGGYDDEHVY